VDETTSHPLPDGRAEIRTSAVGEDADDVGASVGLAQRVLPTSHGRAQPAINEGGDTSWSGSSAQRCWAVLLWVLVGSHIVAAKPTSSEGIPSPAGWRYRHEIVVPEAPLSCPLCLLATSTRLEEGSR
jgi:hypothetical protein